MNLDLAGKVALVTGSSRGLGKAIASSLAREGCRLAINARNSADLRVASAEFDVPPLSVVADAGDPDQARRLVADVLSHFGRLDILVANVGSGRSVPPGQEHHQEWLRVFSLNLWSFTNMVEAARDAFGSNGGCIIGISSICGLGVVPGAPLAYSAAKAALHSYIAGAARPLAEAGIRIAAVAPGNLLFPGSSWERKVQESPESVAAMLTSEVPLRRFGTVEEVADVVAFLASARCAFVTGAVWTVDGGQSR